MRFFLLLCLSLCASSLYSQNSRQLHQAQFSMVCHHSKVPIEVDGKLDEESWGKAAPAAGFSMKWPRDGGPAPAQTEVRCLFDDKFLYVGILAHDSSTNHVIQSLKRDNGYWDSDGVAIILDPTNVAANGYFFGVSAKGVQTDALLTSNSQDMDMNWDNTWWAETQITPYYWTAEFAIPLRILRFKEGQTNWGINIIRNDLLNGIYSTWASIPFQFDGTDLGWTGSLNWEEAPKKTKGNYNLIPYARTGTERNYEDSGDWIPKSAVGLDAKVGIGTGLNLDITANPDFSQIEIDEQLINLTRFDLQLPEKRTFFLENADVFGNFGIPPVRPFFSRRIGLNQEGIPAPILGGLRLTGNLDANTRIGALTMQTRPGEQFSENYSALAINRRVFGRSSVSGYFLNKTPFEGPEVLKNQYSRNAGIEGTYVSLDGKWSSWITHHRSFYHNKGAQNWWGNAGVNYTNRRLSILVDYLHMGPDYKADLGFETRIANYDVLRDTVIRIGYNFLYSEWRYRFFFPAPESNLNYVELKSELFQVINPDGSWNESSNNFAAEINYKNTSSLSFSLSPSYANVPVSFKFDGSTNLAQCPPLPQGRYQFTNGSIKWTSDYRRRLLLSFNTQLGEFYNGNIYSAGAEVVWRYKTLANFRIAAAFNKLDFPAPYCDVTFLNITPRIEVFFARNIWWTTFIQYNNQADNFNINSRFQWRFRPMSDFFLVYTDNYGVTLPGVKNRALVAKASYWF